MLQVAALAVLCALGGWGATARAQAPTVVLDENFENGVGTTPIILTAYTGATGQTYTAAPPWLTNCNGAVVAANAAAGAGPLIGCTTALGYDALRQLAYAQGAYEGAPNPSSVHSVAALTGLPGPGANLVVFQTVTPIPLAASNRFLAFSIDVAGYCTANNPSLGFFLLDGSTRIQLFTSLIDPCTDPRGGPIAVPAIGTRPAATLRVGTYAANRSSVFSGSAVGIQMTNGQGTGSGNDFGFSNIRLLDATPRLDKSFSPAALTVGGTSTLTFTITNTSELAAKNGWSFTDTLPAGLVVASPATASTTCSGGQVAAVAGGGSIAVSGNLAAGQASCTASVNVTASTSGTYTNGPSNVTTTGLQPPPAASVEFMSVDLAILKSASTSTVRPNGQILYTLVVENNGPGDATGLRVTDTPPPGVVPRSADPAQGTCAIVGGQVTCSLGALAAGGSTQVLVTALSSADASGSLTNTATVTGDQSDRDPSNNTATATVDVPSPPAAAQARADVSITKRASRNRVALGQSLTYTIVVTNNGPSPATDVSMTDTTSLPGRLRSVETSAGTCERTLPVTCALGAIAPARSVTITVAFRPTAGGRLRNAASVTGEGFDTRTADNLVVVTTRVESALVVTKVANRRTIGAGRRVSYRIRVGNPSQQAFRAVRTCDRLPVGLLFVRATPRARQMGGRYCWTAGRLGAGRSRTYELTARALSVITGTKVNRATATSPDAATGRARRAVRVTRAPGGICEAALAASSLSMCAAADTFMPR